MALTNGLSFQQSPDIESGVVTDTTDYAVGGNPARSAKANYLLWSKTDEVGNYVLTNPSQGNVFSTLTYTVTTLMDGLYNGILMRFSEYNAATAYVEQQSSGTVITQYPSVVYYSGAIYKAIAPTTGNLPTDTAYWEVVQDTAMTSLIFNTNVETFVQDFYIKVRANMCLNDRLAENCGCGCNGDFYKIHSALLVSAKIMAADSAFANDDPYEMEKIIRDIESTCATC